MFRIIIETASRFKLFCQTPDGGCIAAAGPRPAGAGPPWRLRPAAYPGRRRGLSILSWRIPWTEEPGGLQSMGLKGSQTGLNDSTVATTASNNTTVLILLPFLRDLNELSV